MTDRFYARWLIGGVVVLLIVAGACYLWYQHDIAPYKQEAAEAEKLLRQSEKSKKVSKTDNTARQATDVTPADSDTPTAEKQITDEVVIPDEPVVKVSSFGLGPYPELPKDWIPDYWKHCDTIEDELLTRVVIKMINDGTRDKYSSVGINSGRGLITAIEWGSILVEYETDENGKQRIMRAKGHPDLLPGQYIGRRLSDIPSHIKIVTEEEIAFDPYEYLGLR